MKKTEDTTTYYFVDESGDPTFYDAKGNLIVGTVGVSKILLLGFIKTTNPIAIRKALQKLQSEIAADTYLKDIPSIQKSIQSFHAKDDCPEVREKVFKTISGLDFSAEVFVARKIQKIFNNKHKGKENVFYDDLISKLFENKLHLSKKNYIYFAVRGSKKRQKPLETAIQKAVEIFEKKWKVTVEAEHIIQPQSPVGEPCLQVIDYINWAVQRAFIKSDMRYYRFIEDKISFLVDVYDKTNYPKNYYTKKNKFDIKKMSPL